ncbi:MAG TPA: hypothetical protein VJS40_08925 [Aestuariivirgaceae bacterium]|nr:hypothetical protein [Aestuariivirgaceae bacterium]
MRIVLNRPSNVVVVISVVLALLALIGLLASVPMLSGNVLLLLAISYVVLLVGVLVKGA